MSARDDIERLVGDDPIARRLVPIMMMPTGTSTAGYPYLERAAWERFRDTIPHILGAGQPTLEAARKVLDAAMQAGVPSPIAENLERATKVVRQVVMTAAVTAPPDLWLLRHVLGTLAELGLTERLLGGEAIYPGACDVVFDSALRRLEPAELDKDLHFLLSRGFVEQYDDSFRIAGHPRVHAAMASIRPTAQPAGISRSWARLFTGSALQSAELDDLRALGAPYPQPDRGEHNHWVPDLEDVELGYRIVPLVLGLRAAGRNVEVTQGPLSGDALVPEHPDLGDAALSLLEAAGWLSPSARGFEATEVGSRALRRGPGPFGIVETYHPYMDAGSDILLGARRDAWVQRGENVGASQDANRRTFEQANDSLDRFCADTGFEVRVFVEHAIGRGEATRQRMERSAGREIRYFGADLEDAAIDAAAAERDAGNLPPNMVFVRRADIGKPQLLVDALREAGAPTDGAVMLVGNGFHEVRNQTDEGMVEMFRQYHDAGFILLFTEENALSVDDLRATAFNTYHAGFKYVHEKSGQGLRPAEQRPRPRLGRPLRAPWSECAAAAGYRRLERYCTRTRTIYPYTPPSGHNPSISVNHFLVPSTLVDTLDL